MRIKDGEMQALQSRLSAPAGAGSAIEQPPTPVPSLFARLVDPATIRATVTSYHGGPPTTVWTVYAVSETALVYVEVEFDEQQYTGAAERDVSNSADRKHPEPNLRAAWVRPLHQITEMAISRSSTHSDSGHRVVAASVQFAGVDKPVELPDQHLVHGDAQWARSDELLRLIRDAIAAPR